jgi:hypothetical protein
MKVEIKKLSSIRKEEEKIHSLKEVSEETLLELELQASHNIKEGAKYGT